MYLPREFTSSAGVTQNDWKISSVVSSEGKRMTSHTTSHQSLFYSFILDRLSIIILKEKDESILPKLYS
jgi:hypothetical protein